MVVRNDLDPDTSRSARPILVHRAIDGSPRPAARWHSSAHRWGPARWPGFVADSGLRPRYPAVEIYRVASAIEGRRSRRALLRRHRSAGPRRRRSRGAAASRRAATAAGPAAAGSGADDRGRPRRRAADARRDRHRHPGGPRDRLRPGRPAFVGDPGARRRAAHLQPGTRLPRPGRRPGVRRLDRRPDHRVELVVGFHRDARRRTRRPPRPPRSTATRRPRGCPTRCRPPSVSGCRWISTTR